MPVALKALVDKTWESIQQRKFRLHRLTTLAVRRYLACALKVDQTRLKSLKSEEYRRRLASEIAAMLGDENQNEWTKRGYILSRKVMDAIHMEIEGDKSAERHIEEVLKEVQRRVSMLAGRRPTLYAEVETVYFCWYKRLQPLNLFGPEGKQIERAKAAHIVASEEFSKRPAHERLQIQVILDAFREAAREVENKLPID